MQTEKPEAPAMPAEQSVVAAYVAAHEQSDYDLVAPFMAAGVRLRLENGRTYLGREDVVGFLKDAVGPSAPGAFKLLPTVFEGRHSAANYVRGAEDPAYRLISLDVLSIEDGKIVDIRVLPIGRFAELNLPASL